jgi:hypothetical protein
VNGGNTVASFNNVVLAAQGRDLTIGAGNMQFAFGSGTTASTFYAGAGRTISLAAQQFVNNGGDIHIEGAGTIIFGAHAAGFTDSFAAASAQVFVNGGTLAIDNTVNNLPKINVATGATLQPGLTAGSSLSVNNGAQFANNAQLKILANAGGTTFNQLQNGTITKNPSDTFQIVLSGLNPSGSYTPNAIIVQAGTLSGFGPTNTTYNQSSPGNFVVTGDGFNVPNWSLTVLNSGNQIQLNSLSASPVPEPGLILLGCGAVVGFRRLTRKTA